MLYIYIYIIYENTKPVQTPVILTTLLLCMYRLNTHQVHLKLLLPKNLPTFSCSF